MMLYRLDGRFRTVNFLPASDDFCSQLITFAYSFDPYLDPNCLTLMVTFESNIFLKLF